MRTRLFLLFVILFLPVSVRAQWVTDGTPLTSATGSQMFPRIAADGAGGAIIAWEDRRSGRDVYAQRVSAGGVAQWTVDGVVICNASGNQTLPLIVADGSGGAIITWTDTRSGNSDIYVQRVNASGAVQWTANGVALCTAANEQTGPVIVSDGAGGAIVAWLDRRTGQYALYSQRINSAGVVQWTADGVTLSQAANISNGTTLGLVADAAGGAIAAWADQRSGNYDVYAQRINQSGVVQWTTDGVAVRSGANHQFHTSIAADGAGGAVIVWEDVPTNFANYELYAQRINSAGAAMWATSGVAVSVTTGDQRDATVCWNNSTGAIVAWNDTRVFPNDIYAQRINPTGITQWTTNGVPVCLAANNQTYPRICSDQDGGAVMVWFDSRFNAGNFDTFAQRIGADGLVRWTTDGVAVCTNPEAQWEPYLVPDGAGGTLITWHDERGIFQPTQEDIYAQRVENKNGSIGHHAPILTSSRDVPYDQGGKVILNWLASDLDQDDLQTIQRYTIWRATDVAPSASAIASGAVTVVDRPMTHGAPANKPIVWHERSAATEYYWELVGSQIAYYYSAYTFTASTRYDSTASSVATHYFRVAAEGATQFDNWPSNVLPAHSVDNLAPPAPLFFTAQRSGANVNLKWNGVHVKDLDKYTVYRGTSTGVTAIPANFLADNPDTIMVDAGAPASALYYVVTASDIHQNQGLKSNEASVAATTGVGGNLPPISALTVLQNRPNPFNGVTDLQVGLPSKSDVRVEIYDVAGRRVRTALMPAQAKGWNTLRITALDDRGAALASGVYFFRIQAGAETVTKKMVIAR